MLGKTLTQLVCPLCGRFVSLNYFDPSGFDLDIYVVEVTGLGRGKGVKVTGTYSILKPGDAAVELIKDRLLDLSQVLIGSNCLKPVEVLSRLKIEAVSPREFHKLRGDVEALTAELEGAERERNRWRVEAETHYAKLENLKKQHDEVGAMINRVEDALATGLGPGEEWVWEADEEEHPVEALRERLTSLMSEYESSAAQLEEKGREISGLYEEVGDMINSIEEALTADGEEWIWEADEEEEPLEALKERLQDLLNEYESLASEAE